GTASLAALIAAIDDGILLDQTLGGGPDLAGDFSVNVDLGYRIQNGHITGRVKDTMLAGNVYTALQDCQLANDLSWQGN
ncbi:metallopeptidase TldD-related protein, partial [Klebsiella pneumoniae]|nr:metallopeptidase TldD-related protein [Klebsiella pneumoniae]